MTTKLDGNKGVIFPDNSEQASAAWMGFRNKIINGDMRIDQRNSGAAVTSNSVVNPYTVDRWRAVAPTGVGSGHFSTQQNAGGVTPPTGFTHYIGVTSLAATVPGATHAYSLRQPIEGVNIVELAWGTANAKTVSLSFLVRSSLTGVHGGALLNQANDRSYPFSFTINVANTWEYKTLTITGDTTGVWKTDVTCGIDLFFNLGAGASASAAAGVWGNSSAKAPIGAVSVVSTNGATFYITGVQLEAAAAATPFERRPYPIELSMCQRYLPAIVSTGAVEPIGIGFAANTTEFYSQVKLPVTPRVAPTGVEISAPSHFVQNPYSGTAGATTAVSLYAGGVHTCRLKTVGSGLTAGAGGDLILAVGGKLLFTGCEL